MRSHAHFISRIFGVSRERLGWLQEPGYLHAGKLEGHEAEDESRRIGQPEAGRSKECRYDGRDFDRPGRALQRVTSPGENHRCGDTSVYIVRFAKKEREKSTT